MNTKVKTGSRGYGYGGHGGYGNTDYRTKVEDEEDAKKPVKKKPAKKKPEDEMY
jgi:hypothetical protein